MLQTCQQIAVTVVDEGVSRAASLAGVPIGSVCGGTMSCGTCHVYVDGQVAGLADPVRDELELLEGQGAYRSGRSRLACQVVVTEAMTGRPIEIAPEN